METVETVETVETKDLKKYVLLTFLLTLTDSLKARDASASKKSDWPIGRSHS